MWDTFQCHLKQILCWANQNHYKIHLIFYGINQSNFIKICLLILRLSIQTQTSS
jgi:hypothetical protein